MNRKITSLVLTGLGCSGALAGSLPASPAATGAIDPATRLHVFGTPGLTAAEREQSPLRRLDGSLVAIARSVDGLAPESALATLHALNPAAHFRTRAPQALPEVLVDIVAEGDTGSLESALEAHGMEGVAVFSNDIGGWLPVGELPAVADLPGLRLARASLPRTRVGAVTSQGDFTQRSDVLRSSASLDGTGVMVGVLSDSFNCYAYYGQQDYPPGGTTGYAQNGFVVVYAGDVSTGDLPETVKVLEDADCPDYGAPQQLPFGDEGRAILQIIHDIAPGAGLAFYTAVNSEADFANGIEALQAAGAKVIDDDVGYPDEPFFQDGVISQAIDAVEAKGAAYFSSAGNDGHNSYENLAPSFPVTATGGANAGEKLLNFTPTASTPTTVLPITIPELEPGEYIVLTLEWDQPYVTGAPGSPGSANALDLCLTDSAGTPQSCSTPNAVGGDPVVYVLEGNPASASGNQAAQSAGITIGLAKGVAPGLVKFALLDDGAGATIDAYQTNSPTVQGHPGAAGAAAVGAADYFYTPRCGTAPATLETYSSAGGDAILFDENGNRLATPVTRQKPDFVAADGVSNTFLGFQIGAVSSDTPQCVNSKDFPNFYGTSAAGPHAAAVAALFLQAQPNQTPAAIYSALSSTALSMGGGASPNFDSGSGFIQADAAFAALPANPSTPPVTTNPSTPPAAASGGGAFAPLDLGVLALLGGAFRRRRPARSAG